MVGINRRDFLERLAIAPVAASMAPQVLEAMVEEGQFSPRVGAQAVRGVGSWVYNPTQATGSSLVDEQIAYAINMHVPRTTGYKWGYRGQLLGMGSSSRGCSGGPKGNYMFTMQNEFSNETRDPIRMLTSDITVGNNPQISVQRNDWLSALVNDPREDNYMEWVFKRPNGNEVADLKINNLRREHPQARTEFTYNNASDLGIRLDGLQDVNPYHGDMHLFHKSLRFIGDPFSIHTARMTSDGIDGHGVYEAVGYRIEPDGSRGPIMAAQIAMVKEPRSANGLMTRIDDRTLMFNSDEMLNEFALVYWDPQRGPGWYQGTINEFRIATRADQPWAKQTEFHRPKLYSRPEVRHWLGE
jgi:hypothetical protein